MKCHIESVELVLLSCTTLVSAVWLCPLMPSTKPLAEFLIWYWLLSYTESFTLTIVPMSGPVDVVVVVVVPPPPEPPLAHPATTATAHTPTPPHIRPSGTATLSN